jgi:N-acetylneuraminic acid mutarotase/regulation of enolase protein 1 (concanavalin A-like superfamily)
LAGTFLSSNILATNLSKRKEQFMHGHSGEKQSARSARSADQFIDTLEQRMLMSTAPAGAILIDSGGPAYTDSLGQTWHADADFSGGSTTVGSFPVANTADASLYSSRRWGNFSYNIPLPTGAYTVTLLFCESRDTAPGERLFNVSAEGAPILTNFDLFATAGLQTAYNSSFNVQVSDGTLNLKFVTVKDTAIVSGIEVVPVMVPAPAPPVIGPPIVGSPITVSPIVTQPVTTAPPSSPFADSDIGSVGMIGSAATNANGSITVTGGGGDIWNDADAFNFAYEPLVGDGSIVTQITSQQNTSSWAKAGVMIRESLASDSRFAMLALTPGNGVTFQARSATHTTPTLTTKSASIDIWLKLTRTGNSITGSISTDDKNWTTVGSATIPMVNNVFVGFSVTAHDNTKLSSATFSNISVTPAGTTSSAWSDGSTSPMNRWESQSFTYNGDLYVFGGYTDRTLDVTTECDVYIPSTNTWIFLTQMPAAITHGATTVVGNTVYIAGGNIGAFTTPSKSPETAGVLTYNLDTNTWGSIAAMPSPAAAGGLVSINNVLYFYGGVNQGVTTDLSNTWAFDLNNPSAGWVAKAAMPDARNHMGFVEINNIAYAIGGQHLYQAVTGNDAEVDAYDPATNTWTTMAPLPMPWSAIEDTTLVINNKIVILGGQTNGGFDGIYLNNIEQYDPTTNLWTSAGTLPEANEGEAAAYINGELIVADGTVDNLGGWAQQQTWIDAMFSV